MTGRVRLNRALQLETSQSLSDGAGGYQIVWTPVGTIWAHVAARTGRTRAGEFGDAGQMSLVVSTHWAPQGHVDRPQTGQRFRDGARLYRIDAVHEADAVGRHLTCYCQEELGP